MDEPFSGGESSSSAAAGELRSSRARVRLIEADLRPSSLLSPNPAPPSQSKPKTKTKKKDVTLNPPIFPNGLKDYHEMAIAAEALSGLLGGPAVVAKNEKSSGGSLFLPSLSQPAFEPSSDSSPSSPPQSILF